MQEYISSVKGQKVEINIPKKGDKLKLIHMIENNIEINHKEKAANVLEELASLLKLEGNIESIEAYDISNIRNDYIVGAGICFEGNRLNKNKYRKFKIKGINSQNDVYSMGEVIKRRISHIEDWGQPDLICIDGGKQQVNMAKDIIKNSKLDIPVIGMIKDDKHRTRGIIDLDGNEVDLRKKIEYKRVFNFLTFIQDEVHRFVITYHRKLRDSIK
jgi:excinuclease ABC subunit C